MTPSSNTAWKHSVNDYTHLHIYTCKHPQIVFVIRATRVKVQCTGNTFITNTS